jgi:hypothetical protein
MNKVTKSIRYNWLIDGEISSKSFDSIKDIPKKEKAIAKVNNWKLIKTQIEIVNLYKDEE